MKTGTQQILQENYYSKKNKAFYETCSFKMPWYQNDKLMGILGIAIVSKQGYNFAEGLIELQKLDQPWKDTCCSPYLA